MPGHPDFLDLPWDEPILSWKNARLLSMPEGVHRHPVVFVAYDDVVYAIKELPRRHAEIEFSVLRALQQRTSRSAEPAGLVERVWLDDYDEQSAAIITRFVPHAFPYRHLIADTGFGPRRGHIVDALAGLLVELHLSGCYWGDCSLSNVLCRYDAGAIEAIMIDAETSMMHPVLSDGQRREDLAIMTENIAGEMGDIAAEGHGNIDDADLWLGVDISKRYEQLWTELNDELIITPDEGYRARQRVARLNELGFSVGQVDLEPTVGGDRVRMMVEVGGRTFHSHRLQGLTGIDASENQAQYIYNDLITYMPEVGAGSGTGKNIAAIKWRLGSFEPSIAWIEREWPGSDPVQGFCDFLLFRRGLADSRGRDVPNDEALETWAIAGFPGFPPTAVHDRKEDHGTQTST
jgi:hypothetical protein